MRRKALLGAVLALAIAAVCALPTLAFAADFEVKVDGEEAAGSYHWIFDGANNALSESGNGAEVGGAANYASYDADAATLTLKGSINLTHDGIDIDRNITVLIDGDVTVYTAAGTEFTSETDIFSPKTNCEDLLFTTRNHGSLTIASDAIVTSSGQPDNWCIHALFGEYGTAITFSDLSALNVYCNKNSAEAGYAICVDGDLTFTNIGSIDIACTDSSFTEQDPDKIDGIEVISINSYDTPGEYITLTFDNCPSVKIRCVEADCVCKGITGYVKDISGGEPEYYGAHLVLKSSTLNVDIPGNMNHQKTGIELAGSLTVDAYSNLRVDTGMQAVYAMGGVSIAPELTVTGGQVYKAEELSPATFSNEWGMFIVDEESALVVSIVSPYTPEPEPVVPIVPATGDAAPLAGAAVLVVAAAAGLAIARRRLA